MHDITKKTVSEDYSSKMQNLLNRHFNPTKCQYYSNTIIFIFGERGVRNVIKLRNDGFEGNTKNVLLFFRIMKPGRKVFWLI